MDMEPPVTPKPMPASAAKLPLDHTNKLFGIVYITLTGVIDTIVPAAGLWLWVGKSMSYLIKLAPILWWALLTQSATRQFSNASKLANQGWFPDRMIEVLPTYWLVGEPFGEPFGDSFGELLRVLIPQEELIKDIAASSPGVLEGGALGIFFSELGIYA
ncbi:hypothetical protein DSO57_1013948 [Entomophthora muscae]|uniref:Uncharacterized protein n=1 Tax=Entomophthora muscae TaxID=34485 RepID=A0ACC2RKA3_9FUNG|nr:hypothetical protein DSO57_1013948 [Entomophthora muscae]